MLARVQAEATRQRRDRSRSIDGCAEEFSPLCEGVFHCAGSPGLQACGAAHPGLRVARPFALGESNAARRMDPTRAVAAATARVDRGWLRLEANVAVVVHTRGLGVVWGGGHDVFAACTLALGERPSLSLRLGEVLALAFVGGSPAARLARDGAVLHRVAPAALAQVASRPRRPALPALRARGRHLQASLRRVGHARG